jgi:dATP pyrophosphohydrolase
VDRCTAVFYVPAVQHPIVRVFDCHVARQRASGFEFLLLQRAPDRIYGGDWRMVGGKIAGGESAWQACLRELYEETRLSPTRLFCVPYINRFYEWQHDRINDIPVFLALTNGAEPTLDREHVAAAWLAPDAACERLVWPGQVAGLRAALALLTEPTTLVSHLEVDPKLFSKS